MKQFLSVVFTLLAAAGAATLYADSVYPQRPEDPQAVYLTRDQFDVHADGIGDDAEALQQAINRVQGASAPRERLGQHDHGALRGRARSDAAGLSGAPQPA